MPTGKPRKGSGSGTNAARTASGGGKSKSYPLPDQAAADSAIDLRHNGNDLTAKQVLDKPARSKFGKNPVVKTKITRARKVDRGGK